MFFAGELQVKGTIIALVMCVVFFIGGVAGAFIYFKECGRLEPERIKAQRSYNGAVEALSSGRKKVVDWRAIAGTSYDVLRGNYLTAERAAAGKNIISTLNELDGKISSAQASANSNNSRLNSAHTSAVSTTKALKGVRESLESSIERVYGEWYSTFYAMDATDKKLATERINASEKLKEVSELVRAEQKKWEIARETMRGEINYKKRQLAKFQEDINPQVDLLADPDAVVQSAAFAHQFVVLDIGLKQGVQPGMIFIIFRRTREGHLLVKGKVRVSEVHDYYCEAGIIELVDKLKPIIKGDMAQSPEFPQTLRYFLYGEYNKSETEGYTKAEIGRLVEKAGGIVLDHVDISTDVLLIGDISKLRGTEEFDRILNTAKDFQILLLRVPAFLRKLELRK